MEEKKTTFLYKCIKGLVKLFYPRIRVSGTEHLPAEPCILVGNHSKMNGPIACELYIPGKHAIWCAGQMMVLKEVPAYAYQDFWSGKPKWSQWFYKLLSCIIAPFSVCVFNNAHTIPVYHDNRALGTFKKTVAALQEGASVVIFPEKAEDYNHILCQFQDKFIDVAKLYYKRTGKALDFVPLYIAPALKTMYLGEPIRFCPENPMAEERQRICDYLMASITDIAVSLPEHTVVPYRNIPKKDYPTNIPKEEPHEAARH